MQNVNKNSSDQQKKIIRFRFNEIAFKVVQNSRSVLRPKIPKIVYAWVLRSAVGMTHSLRSDL